MTNHIINGHYMFGNTFIQPEIPVYYRIAHHNLAPTQRPIPPYPDIHTRPITCPSGQNGCCLAYEDSANKIDAPYTDPNTGNKCECNDCPFSTGGIVRDPLMFSVVNIETSIIKTLKVTIYGTSAEQDKTVDLKMGNRYAITYITEHGLITSVGRLELISESVPDACTRYINTTNMAAASTAYIGMDCSTEYNSDKRKIYIATIRYIQEINDGDEVENVITEVSLKDRFEKLLIGLEENNLTARTTNLLNEIDKYEIMLRIDKLLTNAENDELKSRLEKLLDNIETGEMRERIKVLLDKLEEAEIPERVDDLLDEIDGFQVTVLETI